VSLGHPLSAQNMANAEISVIQTEVGLHMKSFLLLGSAQDQHEEQYPLQGCKQCVFFTSLLEKGSTMIHLPKELGLQPGNGVLDLNFFQDPELALLQVLPAEFLRAACLSSLRISCLFCHIPPLPWCHHVVVEELGSQLPMLPSGSFGTR